MTINIWIIAGAAGILFLTFIILHFIERRGIYMFQNGKNSSSVPLLLDNDEPEQSAEITSEKQTQPDLKPDTESMPKSTPDSAPTVSIPNEPINHPSIIQLPVASSRSDGKEQLIGYQVKKYLMLLALKIDDQDWEGIKNMEGFTSSFRDTLIANFQNRKADIPIPKTPKDYVDFMVEKEEGIYILSYAKQHWMCLDNGTTFIVCGFYQG